MSVINTNIKSMVAQDSLTINNRKLATAMERLSTGSRINSAADDAAGLGISTRMDSQVRGLNMAIRNANDTISVVQTAEGAMQEVNAILQRMRELSVQSASDTNSGIDRSYIQAEVSQLSSEIDRIADTTQWNAVNILDGSYANKLFQIGANANQTIGFSVGSMKSSVLGVASSQPNNGVMPGVPAAGVSGAVAEGTAASPTVIRLEFEESDTYTFTVADDVTGLAAAGVATKAVDLTSEKSKTDFLDTLNKAFKEAAVDTSLKGSATLAATINLNDSDNFEDVRFSISVAGGTPAKSIDLTSRLLSSAVNTAAVTQAEVATAMQTELQALFDNSITATQTGGVFTVKDAQGRELEISQGPGSGAIFGTDAANDGPLQIDATIQSSLSAAWDGDDLVVTNSAGGKTTVAGYVAAGGSKVMFNAVNDVEAGQNYDPIALVAADTSSDTVFANGRVEDTSMALTFSDRIGTGADAKYTFKLTTGDGDVLATLTDLDVHTSKAAATIEATVRTALTAGLAAAGAVDESIDLSDFEVSFSGNTLNIVNTSGLSLRIEDFSSSVGAMTVTPMNELGAAEVLASQSSYYSTGRLAVDSVLFSGLVTTADNANKFDIYVDGIKSTAGLTLTGAAYANLTALATDVEDKIQAVADIKLPGGNTAMQDLDPSVTVTAEAETNSLLIRDSLGRQITIVANTGNLLPNAIFLDGGGSTVRNDGYTAKIDSSTVKGGLYEATKVSMKLNMEKADFDFSLNGMFLADATTTAAVATVSWDSTASFAGSTMQTKLDALMDKLNSFHPEPVYEYEVSGNEITFYHRGGGTLEIGEFEVATGYDGLKATITPATGQGESAVIQQHQLNATAYATGSAATATSAVLQLSGDDLISLSVSDGKNSFLLGPTAVDVDNLNSTTALTNKLNDILGGSSIRASMDTKGNLYFTDTTGGTVSLTGFSSARGLAATWAPEVGQGNSMTVNNGFVGTSAALAPVVGGVGGGAGTAIAQISVTSQSGANQALTVIDAALSYVNAERSKLGAIENRLTHTIDNLTNIVTNTAASRSRIKDTDYAQETTELARTQIIQQAATAMLAQANQQPQSVLALLQ